MSSIEVNGAEIQRLREERHLERKELAELVGISAFRIYAIERRENSTRYSTLRKIAMALGVSPESLHREKSTA